MKGWIITIIVFILLANGKLANMFNDYQGSDGMMHSGLVRILIIGGILYFLFKSPAKDVVKAAVGK